MKTRPLVSILSFVFAAAVIFIFASCDNGGVTPTFMGTWVNPDYDGTGTPAKMVITHVSGNDYMCVVYENHDDTEPEGTIPVTVTNQWTDSEGNLFSEAISYADEVIYGLSKIHADNQTIEVNNSYVDYPTEIDPNDEEYYIYYRQ